MINNSPTGETIYCHNDKSEPYPEPYQNNSCKGTGDVLWVMQTNKVDSSIDVNAAAILELCEVEVYGENDSSQDEKPPYI